MRTLPRDGPREQGWHFGVSASTVSPGSLCRVVDAADAHGDGNGGTGPGQSPDRPRRAAVYGGRSRASAGPCGNFARHPIPQPTGKTLVEHALEPIEQRAPLPRYIDPPPVEPARTGNPPQGLLHPTWIGVVMSTGDPIRSPLKNVPLACRCGQLGNDLDGAGPVAHDGQVPPPGIELVIPTGRVKGGTTERAQPLNRWRFGKTQLPHRTDEYLGRQFVSLLGQNPPRGCPCVECGTGNRGAKAKVRANAELIGAIRKVF